MSIVVEKMILHSKNLLVMIIICCGLCFGEECTTPFEAGNDRSAREKMSSMDEIKECLKKVNLIVNLNFSSMGLRQIGDGFISSAGVTHLSLEGNEIEGGSFLAFEKLPNLRYLNLARNKLHLPNFLASGVHENLDTLILDRMQHINFGSFEIGTKLPKLSHLHLEDHQLGSIFSRNWTQTLPSLTHLYFSGNNIKNTLNEFLLHIPSTIRHLYVERNEIESINFNHDNSLIITLSLDGNKINCLGQDGWDSAIIERCHNTMLSQFENLEFLSISSNEIFHLYNNAFEQNTKLVSLNISKNRISDINDTIYKNLYNLEMLDLSDNRLEKVSGTCGLKKLRNLYLDRNLINNIKSESICSSDTLTSLSLIGNYIKTIQDGTFDNLINLVELNLSDNKLAHFDCQKSTNLKNLFLSGNQFRSLDDILLGNQTFLHMILEITQ